MDVSDFAKTIKLNILRVLAEQGVSKNELSRRTGISSGGIVVLLNGDREIQTDTMQKIADALNISLIDLAVEPEHASR
jgi:DNA-binding Xre family transcriptional regulator